MDEQQFDKNIRNILENGPPFEPSGYALKDMHARLDQAYGRSKWWRPWWWWIPLLTLPFALGMIFFFIKFQNLNNKLDEINLHLSQHQIDTITHNYIVYHYDTIYSKVFLTQGVEQPSKLLHTWSSHIPFTTAVPSFYSSTIPEATGGRLLDQITSGQLRLADLKESLFFPEKEQKEIAPRTWAPLFPIRGPRPWPLPETNLITSKVGFNFPLYRISQKNTKPVQKPLVEGIQIGGFFGLASLMEHSNSPFWEANIDLLFSRKLKLRTGFQQIGISFEEKEEDHFDQYPIGIPDNPGDELKEIKANYSFARIPVRVIYTFYSQKSIQPYIGIGFSGIKMIRPELKYEFFGSSGEYYKTQAFDSPSISLNNFEFGAGLEFYLGKGINASLEGYRFQNFDGNLEQINRLSHFGGKVGLHYTF